MQLVPYSFSGVMALPEAQIVPIERGMFSGIHLVIEPGALDRILEKIEVWFEDRDEVILVDSGVSSKQGMGYIILEWEECEIDPLFIAILNNEDVVEDYSLYIRLEEV